MATRPVTVNDVLVGHVALDVECFDRIYLNGYVPNLQVGGQVVNFLTHRRFPIPSPSLLEKNGTVFRRAVESYAEGNGIPWVRFVKGEPEAGGDGSAPGAAGPAGPDRGGGDRGGAEVSAGVHRHHAPPRGWWGSAFQLRQGRPAGHRVLLLVRREAPSSYTQLNWEELGGTFLGLMAHLDPKGEGDKSMPGKQQSCPGVRGEVLRDPRDMVKA